MPRPREGFHLDPELHPWERQPGETSKAWEAFVHYRDMTSRSIRNLALELDRPNSMSMFGMWSTAYMWQERCYRYDLQMDKEHREWLAKERVTMARRQMRTAAYAQSKISEYLLNLDPTKMTHHAAAVWFDTAVKVERAAAGEGTKVNVHLDGSLRLDDLSAEEVESRLRDLQGEIARVLDGDTR